MEQFHLVTHKLHSPETNHPLQTSKTKTEKRDNRQYVCSRLFFYYYSGLQIKKYVQFQPSPTKTPIPFEYQANKRYKLQLENTSQREPEQTLAKQTQETQEPDQEMPSLQFLQNTQSSPDLNKGERQKSVHTLFLSFSL